MDTSSISDEEISESVGLGRCAGLVDSARQMSGSATPTPRSCSGKMVERKGLYSLVVQPLQTLR